MKFDRLGYINIALLLIAILVAAVVITRLVAVIDHDKKLRAEAETRQIVAMDALTANQDLFGRLESFMSNACTVVSRLPSQSSDDVKYLSDLCARFKNDYVNYDTFLTAYNRAVASRVVGDFAAARVSYEDATRVQISDKGWSSRAAEGLAYILMEQGKLQQAGDQAAKAAVLDRFSEFAGATALKVKCSRSAPKTEIAADYVALATRLKSRPSQVGKDAMLIRNAKLEYDYLRRDAELYSLCAYAGITFSG